MPTDVVPFYEAWPDSLASLGSAEFTLSSAAGETIAAQPAGGLEYATQLKIEHALQPNTTYTLVAKLAQPSEPDFIDTLSLTFTTGGGPVSAPPAQPQAFLGHYRFAEQPSSSCSPLRYGTCVAVTAGLPVEETEIDEAGQEIGFAYLRREPWFTDLTSLSQGAGTRCVKLRSRGANAVYSSPLVLCGTDAPLFTLRGSEDIGCTAQGLTQDGAVVTSSAGGAGEYPTAQGGAASGGVTRGGAGGAPTTPGGDEAAFGKPGGAANGSSASVGNPTSTSCALAPGRNHAPNAALGALFALALAARFRSTRRRA